MIYEFCASDLVRVGLADRPRHKATRAVDVNFRKIQIGTTCLIILWVRPLKSTSIKKKLVRSRCFFALFKGLLDLSDLSDKSPVIISPSVHRGAMTCCNASWWFQSQKRPKKLTGIKVKTQKSSDTKLCAKRLLFLTADSLWTRFMKSNFILLAVFL